MFLEIQMKFCEEFMMLFVGGVNITHFPVLQGFSPTGEISKCHEIRFEGAKQVQAHKENAQLC